MKLSYFKTEREKFLEMALQKIEGHCSANLMEPMARQIYNFIKVARNKSENIYKPLEDL